jgi:hypothetical protein
MKNVAKCDTWCELQNPVNHRVFERKLRPTPSGGGHACLGVTPRVAPRSPLRRWAADAEIGPPRPRARWAEERAAGGAGHGEWWTRAGRRAIAPLPRGRPSGPERARRGALAPRPQVRRGHPLSLSISISGGEETYEDSPSNGERTGISPA